MYGWLGWSLNFSQIPSSLLCSPELKDFADTKSSSALFISPVYYLEKQLRGTALCTQCVFARIMNFEYLYFYRQNWAHTHSLRHAEAGSEIKSCCFIFAKIGKCLSGRFAVQQQQQDSMGKIGKSRRMVGFLKLANGCI